MRRILAAGVASFVGLAGWAMPAGAGLLSTTGPVIAIVADDLFLGEAEGHLGGSGTIRIQSQAKPEISCRGQFSHRSGLGDKGDMQCSDGATATFRFRRLSLVRGYGTGSSSRGPMSFTYGLSATESEPYLKLPPGKALSQGTKELQLVDAAQPAPAKLPAAVPAAPAPEAAPDALLSAATLVVIAKLRQDQNGEANSPAMIAELMEATILPLFDFRHMAQLAVARNWHLASAAQQDALVAEFRTLLVRTYSTALTNYRNQAIEYKPLRMVPG